MTEKPPARVAGIKPWRKNPRKISDKELAELKRSMETFGDLGGVVFNLTTGHVVGGHQRLKNLDPSWKIERRAATDKTGTVALGYITTPYGRFNYREVRWPEIKETAANLAANKIQGEWDNEKLAPILEDLIPRPEFELTGFKLEEANLIIEAFDVQPNNEDDEVPPTPPNPITKLGHIWKLGPHCLFCGDATRAESWAKLMAGKKAALCITDFPYGVDYNVSSKTVKDRLTGKRIPHNARADVGGDVNVDVAMGVLPEIFNNLIDEGVAYFTCGTNLAVDIMNWLRQRDIHYGTLMVWHKHFAVVSWNRYHAEHELIVYAGKGSRPGKYARWFGPKDETTVWDIPFDAHADRLHPTQKPVALYERPMINSSAPNEIVVDPCAGSGPLVIAAEKHGRKAYMMEVDPGRCDVIVKRWMGFTGLKAEPITA